MYAALRAIPIPDDVVARLFHAASLLREHRGDGHIAALMIEGVGGLEAHVLFALDMGMPAEKFGRIHHLPAAQLAAVIDGMRDRGLIGDDGWLSERGRAVKQRVEALTDDLAAKPYESLEPDELDELMATLEPLATLLLAAQDWCTRQRKFCWRPRSRRRRCTEGEREMSSVRRGVRVTLEECRFASCQRASIGSPRSSRVTLCSPSDSECRSSRAGSGSLKRCRSRLTRPVTTMPTHGVPTCSSTMTARWSASGGSKDHRPRVVSRSVTRSPRHGKAAGSPPRRHDG